MHKLASAISMAVGTLAFASGAQAATFVVTAKTHSFDSQLARKIEAAGGTITARLPQIGVAIVESDNPHFAKSAGKIPAVRSAVEDITFQTTMPDVQAATADFSNPPGSGDDDVFFDLQWGHAAIDAAGAWNAGYRGAGATVAVLDSGVDCDNPDFAANIDLARSTSFVAGEDVCAVGSTFNHGTHVAGTIAANDNGYGVIGVAPEADLFGVKVLSAVTGSGSFAGIVQGIVYAASQGADVINMSLGVRGGLPVNNAGTTELINATKRAVQYARSQNALVVVSAGNDGRDLDKDSGTQICDSNGDCYRANLRAFPAQVPGTLAVSATTPVGWAKAPTTTYLDNLATYSNYGTSAISIAGPGGDGVAFPGYDTPCTVGPFTNFCLYFDYVMSASPGGFYWSAGTSMAAPHVSGVAALVIGKHGGEMTPSAVESILRASADDLGKPGKDAAYGYGRVNARAAVTN